ncbi:MAG: ATP-binding protein [Rhodobacter sp.]|nr:ATP-binding protein [Rhodobacter sp.]
MDKPRPTLHLLCGKIAAGKSTLAAKLAEPDGTILIAEDDWLGELFREELATARDYVRHASKLRAIMGPHVASLLNAGLSVVLDFQANTVESRRWMRSILDTTQADHQFHILAPPDEVCLERLRERNAQGDHPFSVTEEQFHQISRYFAPPSSEEGFNLVTHRDGA